MKRIKKPANNNLSERETIETESIMEEPENKPNDAITGMEYMRVKNRLRKTGPL